MRFLLFFIFVAHVFLLYSCKVKATLPENAVVIDQLIYVDEVEKGTPQTVTMPDGETFTFKMPEKLSDGDTIKIRQRKNEKPYYIRVKLKKRDEKN